MRKKFTIYFAMLTFAIVSLITIPKVSKADEYTGGVPIWPMCKALLACIEGWLCIDNLCTKDDGKGNSYTKGGCFSILLSTCEWECKNCGIEMKGGGPFWINHTCKKQ